MSVDDELMGRLLDLIARFKQVNSERKNSRWELADIVFEIEEMTSKMGSEKQMQSLLSQLLRQAGVSEKTFSNYKWIARAFPPGPLRNLGLPWTFYRICKHTDNPEAWLRTAKSEHWSTRRLIDEIRQSRAGITRCSCGCNHEISSPQPQLSLSGTLLLGQRLFFASFDCILTYAQQQGKDESSGKPGRGYNCS